MRILFVENHQVFAETVIGEFLAAHDVSVVPTVSAAEVMVNAVRRVQSRRGERCDYAGGGRCDLSQDGFREHLTSARGPALERSWACLARRCG
jgi:hypothetical protein